MRKLFSIFALLFSLSAFAELNVEWIDDSTILVYGYGSGGGVTNDSQLGSCTNCLAITPDEMRAIKSRISDLLIDLETSVSGAFSLASVITNRISSMLSDISGFQRFGTSPQGSLFGSTAAQRLEFTNYVYSVQNAQTQLDISHKPSSTTSASFTSWVAYNNGIYDYATSVVTPDLSATLADVNSMLDYEEDINTKTRSIQSIVNDITEESCQSCGGGSGGGDCSSCPCEEQWETLLDYIRHIDNDQHDRFTQLNQISNHVFNIENQFDSYARLVSGVLLNDATIVVDDGDNSWSNVYRTGYSELYDYNKSNILQRIELLLFGISYNTSTNWGDVTPDVASSVTNNVHDNLDRAMSYIDDANDAYTEQVEDLSDKFIALWRAMNFFGAGSLSNFQIAEPTNTFGLYEMTYDFDKSADLRDLQLISRTCFQIFYWSLGIVFMLAFWFKVVTFTVNISLRVVRFFNLLIT